MLFDCSTSRHTTLRPLPPLALVQLLQRLLDVAVREHLHRCVMQGGNACTRHRTLVKNASSVTYTSRLFKAGYWNMSTSLPRHHPMPHTPMHASYRSMPRLAVLLPTRRLRSSGIMPSILALLSTLVRARSSCTCTVTTRQQAWIRFMFTFSLWTAGGARSPWGQKLSFSRLTYVATSNKLSSETILTNAMEHLLRRCDVFNVLHDAPVDGVAEGRAYDVPQHSHDLLAQPLIALQLKQLVHQRQKNFERDRVLGVVLQIR